jgi:hypothetical protein
MTKIATTYNNFSRAKLDHDLSGRFDLPIYNTGAEEFTNFISNFKGNAIYRAGLELAETFQDCVFVEFEFSQEQSYLCLFYELKVKFLTYDANGNFGFVESSPGVDLEVTSPYTLEQARDIQWAQNADVMKIVHPEVLPKDFTRVSATSFTFANSVTTGAGFDNPSTGTTGYPGSVCFKDGRLFYAAATLKTTTVWASESGDYENFTIPATIVDDSPIQLTIADLTEKVEWLLPSERNVICGNRKNIAVINGGDVNTPLTAANVSVTITGAEGSNSTIPLRKDALVFYLGRNDRNVYYFRYDLLGETFKASDANFVSYDITEGGISKLRYKKDRNDIIYTVRGDGKLLALNFNEEEKIIGWSIQETDGIIQDIATITNNDGDPQLFCLVLRDSVYYVERLADFIEFSRRDAFFTDDEDDDREAYNRMIGEELKLARYLDNLECISNLQDNIITFDGTDTITATSSVFTSGDVGKFIVYQTQTGYEKGRFEITGYTSGTEVEVEALIGPSTNTYQYWYLTFDSLSGLSRFNGKTVSVVADGGYLDDFEVSGGAIDLGTQVTSVCVGLSYTGLIKTFNLGFAIQGVNTQKNIKSVFQAGIRLIDSAGGLIGTTRYRMTPIQELTERDLNYLPPLVVDQTKLITYSDDADINKALYIIQDKPLPMKVADIIIETKYGVS